MDILSRGCVVFAACLLSGCIASGTPTTAPVATPSVLAIFAMPHGAAAAFGGSQRSYHAGTWGVPLYVRQQARSFATDRQLQQLDAWPIPQLNAYCVLYRGASGMSAEALSTQLRNDKRVSAVQPNYAYHGMISASRTYNDPLTQAQYGAKASSLQRLHAVTQGAGVRVGLIDSQVDDSHPDLAGRIARHYALAAQVAPPAQVHGTAVAGVVGAMGNTGDGLIGVAPASQLFSYGACREHGERTLCDSFSVAKAVSHAIDDGIDVLNISLAGPFDPLVARLLLRASQAHNMLVVAAANPADAQRNFPANLTTVYGVRGDEDLWLAAPEQLSTLAGGGYRVFYGSSIAAAGASGVAALLRAHLNSGATVELFSRLLHSGCTSNLQASTAEHGLASLCR